MLLNLLEVVVGSKVGGIADPPGGSVMECSSASVVYREDFADMHFLCYHWSVQNAA